MLTQTSVAGSDDWWLMQLAVDLGAGFPRMGRLRRYRVGDAPVPEEASPAMRAAYVKYVQTGRLNMCDLIVTAKTTREKVIGFRTAVVGDDLGDELAWKNWKRSHLIRGSKELFTDVGHYGSAFVIVTGQTAAGTGRFAGASVGPTFLPRDGWTVASRQLQTAPWLTEAAIQVGYDPIAGVDIINLFRRGYMRTATRVARGKSTIPDDGSVWNPGNGWSWESDPVPYGFTDENVVVRFDAPDAMGVYEKHLDTVDRINDVIKQRSLIVAMQAFRQRAIDGDLPETYPEGHDRAGEKIDYNKIFEAGPAALWLLPTGAKVWESAVTDITGILTASKDDIKHLAAVTSTALYILSPDAQSGSASGADLARESMESSVEDLNERMAEGFAMMHSLGFASMGDTDRTDETEIETIWAPVKRASMLDAAQASAQAKAGGMPQRFIDEKIFGFTPAEQRQARQDRSDDAFDAATAQSDASQTQPTSAASGSSPQPSDADDGADIEQLGE